MSASTRDFDVLVEVRAAVVQAIVRAQHARQVLRHRMFDTRDDSRVELTFGAPTLREIRPPDLAGRVRAVLDYRIVYHRRVLHAPADEGLSRVVDVGIQVALGPVGGNPASIAGGATLDIDWNGTTAPDIVVYEDDAGVAATIRSDILAILTREGRSRIDLGPIDVGPDRVLYAGLRGMTPAGTLMIACNVSLGRQGDLAALSSSFVANDYAIVIGREYLDVQLVRALRSAMGGLPGPRGAGSVLLERDIICAFDTPFGCVDRAERRVTLERLDWSLNSGLLVLTGRLRQEVDSAWVPNVDADFRAEARLSLDASGQLAISTTITRIEVSGFAESLDSLMGGAVRRGVEDALRTAFATQVSGALSSAWFGEAPLTLLAWLRRDDGPVVTARTTSIEVRPDVVVLHGALAVPTATVPPLVELAVVRVPGTINRRMVSATGTWAPSGVVSEIHFDVGGTSVETSGTTLRSTLTLDLPVGLQRVCVTAIDSAGRTATRCLRVEVGAMTLRHRPSSNMTMWNVCHAATDYVLAIEVLDERRPIEGATLEIFGPNWSQTTVTDRRGIGRLLVAHGRPLIPPPAGSVFVRGRLRVEARKTGFATSSPKYVRFVECNLTAIPVPEVRERLKGVIEIVRRTPRGLDEPIIGDPAPLRPNGDGGPSRADDLNLAIDIVHRLIALAERGSHTLHIADVLGATSADAVAMRLGELVKQLERVVAEAQERTSGADPRSRRDHLS